MEHIKRLNPFNPSLCRCPINQGSGFDRFLTRIRSLSSSNGTLYCQECVKKEMGKSFKKKKNVIFGAEFLWVCLDCERIFCGAERLGRPDGHIHYHAITNHHPAAIQIAAWCFECKSIHRITTREVNKDLDFAIEVNGEQRGMEQGNFDAMHGCYEVKPMRNLGNSCFFNAILQNLLSMDVLRADFADLYCQGYSIAQDLWSLFLHTSVSTEGNVVMVGHPDLFASICSRVPHFLGHQQQDSHELLKYLLGELVAAGVRFIEDIFGGRLSSTLSCVQCGNASKSYESFLDLSLAIPSNESSTKKGKFVTSKDIVLPAIDIFSCSPDGSKTYSSMEAIDFGLWAPESLDLPSLLTVHAVNWGTALHGFLRKEMNAKVDKGDPNESSKLSDAKVSIGEDVKNGVASKKRICPFLTTNIDLESRICIGEQRVDCRGQQPCACSEDLIKVAEPPESQQKDHMVVEVEEDPDNCCSPSICSKDLEGAAESPESQRRDHIVEEVEEDPEDSCSQSICNKDLDGAAESLESQRKDQIVEDVEDVEEDPEDCCSQSISNKDLDVAAESLESQRKNHLVEEVEEDPEDCCSQSICNEDLDGAAESLESQQKDQIVEVEEAPQDCCAQNTCICNKDLGGVAESVEMQWLNQMVEEIEKDPQDCCGQNPCICNKDLGGVVESPEMQWKDEKVEEDPEDCCGQNPCISDRDLRGVAESAESLLEDLTEGEVEDSISEVEVLIAERNNLKEKSTEQNDNLDSDDKYLRVKLDVNSRKRPRCASSLKFEDKMQSGDPLSIEKCLDLFTAPEILTGEYACDHCSNCIRDLKQTQLLSTSKTKKVMERNGLGGCGVTDEVKPEVDRKDEGVDIVSQKAKMDASKSYFIFKAPRILTIHLKRFTQDTNGITKKINSHVKIHEILDLTPYMDPSREDKENSRYLLIGVVQHLGVDLMGGHYVAYVRGVRRQGNNELAWFRASDLDVREVTLNQVLNSDAYILFYERM